ncbi:hypothetical protein ACEU6E_06365 [Halorutilales archaeon Cl-col2-1]
MLSKIISEPEDCEECDLKAENRVILDGGTEKLLCGTHADEIMENRPMEIKMIQDVSIWG